jgi:NDP-sugar pyrophosphorylase family protein
MPIKGKPILEYHIDLLRKYEVRDIIFAVSYLGGRIRDYFKDGANHGVRMKYIEEEEPLGTAGGLRLAKPLLDQTFVMANGDNLINIDLHDMFRFHKENNAMATIALTTVDDPSSFGVAKMQGGRILEFIEKPKRGKAPSNLINAGIYILEPEVIELVPKGFSMIERAVFPRIAKMKRLFGYSFSGQWFPTDNEERYESAIKKWRGIR